MQNTQFHGHDETSFLQTWSLWEISPIANRSKQNKEKPEPLEAFINATQTFSPEASTLTILLGLPVVGRVNAMRASRFQKVSFRPFHSQLLHDDNHSWDHDVHGWFNHPTYRNDDSMIQYTLPAGVLKKRSYLNHWP
jgi:hypothetical protein